MDSLDYIDWIVLLVYVATVVWIGIRAGRQERNIADFFLGGRSMPWWLVMVSIYATSLSALTFVGVPGAAYAGDFHFIQLGIGDLIGRIIISFLLLTKYYDLRVTTVYQFLGHRFGPRTHDAGAALFIITRLLASGVRLAGCAIALSVVFSFPLNTTIVFIAGMALLYTSIGGIKAVIWTDLLQFILFIAAAITALTTIILSLPNQWADFLEIGRQHGKFAIFHISANPNDPDYWLNFGNSKSLIAGILLGCLTTLAALGTDQDLVQRMLTCRRVQESQRALLMTILLNVPVTLLFLSVGAALFVYYQVFPDPTVNQLMNNNQVDKIFPYFIRSVISAGFRGFLVAGLLAAAMSSLDSALNALASTAYVDIYSRYVNRSGDGGHAVHVSRLFVCIFCLILAGLSLLFSHTESILWLGFRIVGYTYGALLGIFLLAILTTNRGNDWLNVAAMISSVFIVIFLTADVVGPLSGLRERLLSPAQIDRIAWPWAICIGVTWTFGIGILFRGRRVTPDR